MTDRPAPSPARSASPHVATPSARLVHPRRLHRLATIAAACIAVLVLSAGAAAHGDGASRGFTSSITAIRPADAALSVRILGGDDRIELDVRGHDVVILGYEGEPYLWFAERGVLRNERSPATYLNEERYGSVPLPDRVDPQAPPQWKEVGAAGRPYEWHDHRIHWMSRSDPPVVVADRESRHRVFDWAIPGTVDGEELVIRGALDYAPPPGQRFPRVLLVPLVLLALAGLAVPLVRRRRERVSAGVPASGPREEGS